MIGYSVLEDEPRLRPAPVAPVAQRTGGGKFSLYKIKTECDMVILVFVIITMLLLLSDLFPKTKPGQ